jgi:hypothetical protein
LPAARKAVLRSRGGGSRLTAAAAALAAVVGRGFSPPAFASGHVTTVAQRGDIERPGESRGDSSSPSTMPALRVCWFLLLTALPWSHAQEGSCAGAWSSWSPCSSCETGTQTRNFTVTAADVAETASSWDSNNTDCVNTTEARACVVDVACAGSWSAWGTCSSSCSAGPGAQNRTFTVTRAACGAGAPCPAFMFQSRECATTSECAEACPCIPMRAHANLQQATLGFSLLLLYFGLAWLGFYYYELERESNHAKPEPQPAWTLALSNPLDKSGMKHKLNIDAIDRGKWAAFVEQFATGIFFYAMAWTAVGHSTNRAESGEDLAMRASMMVVSTVTWLGMKLDLWGKMFKQESIRAQIEKIVSDRKTTTFNVAKRQITCAPRALSNEYMAPATPEVRLQVRLQALRDELSGLKPSELEERARAAKVDRAKFADAVGGDTPKETLIELILKRKVDGEKTTAKQSSCRRADWNPCVWSKQEWCSTLGVFLFSASMAWRWALMMSSAVDPSDIGDRHDATSLLWCSGLSLLAVGIYGTSYYWHLIQFAQIIYATYAMVLLVASSASYVALGSTATVAAGIYIVALLLWLGFASYLPGSSLDDKLKTKFPRFHTRLRNIPLTSVTDPAPPPPPSSSERPLEEKEYTILCHGARVDPRPGPDGWVLNDLKLEPEKSEEYSGDPEPRDLPLRDVQWQIESLLANILSDRAHASPSEVSDRLKHLKITVVETVPGEQSCYQVGAWRDYLKSALRNKTSDSTVAMDFTSTSYTRGAAIGPRKPCGVTVGKGLPLRVTGSSAFCGSLVLLFTLVVFMEEFSLLGAAVGRIQPCRAASKSSSGVCNAAQMGHKVEEIEENAKSLTNFANAQLQVQNLEWTQASVDRQVENYVCLNSSSNEFQAVDFPEWCPEMAQETLFQARRQSCGVRNKTVEVGTCADPPEQPCVNRFLNITMPTVSVSPPPFNITMPTVSVNPPPFNVSMGPVTLELDPLNISVQSVILQPSSLNFSMGSAEAVDCTNAGQASCLGSLSIDGTNVRLDVEDVPVPDFTPEPVAKQVCEAGSCDIPPLEEVCFDSSWENFTGIIVAWGCLVTVLCCGCVALAVQCWPGTCKGKMKAGAGACVCAVPLWAGLMWLGTWAVPNCVQHNGIPVDPVSFTVEVPSITNRTASVPPLEFDLPAPAGCSLGTDGDYSCPTPAVVMDLPAPAECPNYQCPTPNITRLLPAPPECPDYQCQPPDIILEDILPPAECPDYQCQPPDITLGGILPPAECPDYQCPITPFTYDYEVPALCPPSFHLDLDQKQARLQEYVKEQMERDVDLEMTINRPNLSVQIDDELTELVAKIGETILDDFRIASKLYVLYIILKLLFPSPYKPHHSPLWSAVQGFLFGFSKATFVVLAVLAMWCGCCCCATMASASLACASALLYLLGSSPFLFVSAWSDTAACVSGFTISLPRCWTCRSLSSISKPSRLSHAT